jgi:excisionase family DNA binding protein
MIKIKKLFTYTSEGPSYLASSVCESCNATTTMQLYGPDEAAFYLGVSYQTLNRWRRQGWIRCSKIGRGYYYQRDALDECLDLRGYGLANNETEVILR